MSKTQYGCHNRPPFKASTKVADGHWDDGVQRIPKLVFIPFRMNTDCQYTSTELGKKDPRCTNCNHRKES